MNDVARQAGVSRMSVYRHFADRDTLVLAVLERITDQTVAAAIPRSADGPCAGSSGAPRRSAAASMRRARWATPGRVNGRDMSSRDTA
jgi:AcrR family transcriptional regulator